MFEESRSEISAQRYAACMLQINRIRDLPRRCPSGMHVAAPNAPLPCFSRSSDPVWCHCLGETLKMDDIRDDENPGFRPRSILDRPKNY